MQIGGVEIAADEERAKLNQCIEQFDKQSRIEKQPRRKWELAGEVKRMREGIITKAVSGEQILLPVWHNITKSEVIAYSPSLADKLARNTTMSTIDEIADEIAELIASSRI